MHQTQKSHKEHFLESGHICCGALYKELVSSYSHKLLHFVTLTFNTDGIPVCNLAYVYILYKARFVL